MPKRHRRLAFHRALHGEQYEVWTMILVRLALLVVLSPFLLVGRLLGFGRRDIAYLPEGHPEMAEAFAKARATLPEFRRSLAAPKPTMGNFAVKARFPVPGGSEHCWVDALESRGSGFVGKLANQPDAIHGMRLGSIADVSEEMITDWAYSEAGVYQGHFTTKVLLPRMSKKMRRQVEAVYGWSSVEESGRSAIEILVLIVTLIVFRRLSEPNRKSSKRT